MKKGKTIAYEQGSGNVYEDLGFRDADAMAVKASLVAKVQEIIGERGLTQMEVAAVTGLPQPRLSAILRGHFHNVSERKLLNCLVALGQDVKITVTPARRGRAAKLSVAA